MEALLHKKKNGLMITLHLAGILLYIFSPLFFGPIRSTRLENVQLSFIAHNALVAGFFYLNMLVLMPLIMKKKDWGLYIFVGLLCTVAFTVVSHYVREIFFRHVNSHPTVFQYFGIMVPYLMAWLFSTSVKFSMDYLALERKRKDSENENLKSELSLLRSQISPHFMFNVLNSLIALARKKSKDLEPIVIKLSQLMRYTIYHSAVPRVELCTEIEYLQNYIDLQKLRFGTHIAIDFKKRIGEPDFQIEPMLLISFVENAFKHGTGLVADPVIEISIHCDGGVLKFSVKNKFVHQSEKEEALGVGLSNVKRRLELLYGDKYVLDIEETAPWFIVNLSLIGK